MAVLRTLIGEALRTIRLRQDRTLREVSEQAKTSLGYLSEVERGQKEASSELLAAICRALGVRLSDVLREVSQTLAEVEPDPVPALVPVPARPTGVPVGAVGQLDHADLREAVPSVGHSAVAGLERVGPLAVVAPTGGTGQRDDAHDVVAAAA